jgi:sulfatase modifying factor 1
MQQTEDTASLSLPEGMCWIAGGAFQIGSNVHYPEERPARLVRVDGFWMDKCTVTNVQFARFVAATGYKTIAERPLDPALYPDALPGMLVPGALLFHMTSGPVDTRDYRNWWRYVPGACWYLPEGEGSSIEGLYAHPVVHVAYEDAEAYAAWAGKSLPTEAEWEHAARGGLEGKEFIWGDEFTPDGRHMANTWQGPFPWRNLANDPRLGDGFAGTAPVGSYPANGFGLFDMAGNVWEWMTDWYLAPSQKNSVKSCCVPENPRGGPPEASYDPAMPRCRIPRKVVKGGSFLCAPSYCRRYRPAARQPQMVDSAMSHIGFRCIIREPKKAQEETYE